MTKDIEDLRFQLMTDDEYIDAVVQEALAKQLKKECPKCEHDGVFDIYEIIGGCEGEVTKIHCPMCSHIFDPRIHWKGTESE